MRLFHKIPERLDTALIANIECFKFDRRVAAVLDEDFGFLELRVGVKCFYGFFAALSRAGGEVDEEGSTF